MRDDDALDNNPHVSRTELEALHGELFAWSLTRCDFDRAAAEDLMQSAYVEVLSGRARFENRSSLKTFLFGTVQMLARSRYRQLTNRMRLLMSHHSQLEPAQDEGDLQNDQASARVWEAVRALPSRQREITELVFCRDLTVEQASAVMGVTVGTGRVHYDRAKKALAQVLDDMRDQNPEEA